MLLLTSVCLFKQWKDRPESVSEQSRILCWNNVSRTTESPPLILDCDPRNHSSLFHHNTIHYWNCPFQVPRFHIAYVIWLSRSLAITDRWKQSFVCPNRCDNLPKDSEYCKSHSQHFSGTISERSFRYELNLPYEIIYQNNSGNITKNFFHCTEIFSSSIVNIVM